MPLDAETRLLKAQTINETENSDNYYDAGAAAALGQGEPIWALLQIASEADTDNTLVATIVGADDIAFSVNKVTVATISKAAADDVPFYRAVPIPAQYKKRYYRVEFAVGGTGPSMVCSFWFGEGDLPQLSHATQGLAT